MKIHLNLVDFYDDISPQEEIIDSTYDATKLIPFGKSGIHIKKENRGSFTSYCGGKVTDACILKGKNSPSAAIRKKATFAANARKWKHQQGGVLIPGNHQDISELFIDVPTPRKYESSTQLLYNTILEDEEELPKYILKDNKKTVPEETMDLKEEPVPIWDFSYEPESYNTATENNTTLKFDKYGNIDFASAEIPDWLRPMLAPHIGKKSGLSGKGYYDCSDFVRKSYAPYKLTGSSWMIYDLVNHVNENDVRDGDLAFVYGTLGDPNKIGHVAIVTNSKNFRNNRILQVALGTPSKKDLPKYTGIKLWDLNSNWFKNHRVVFGRPRQSAKLGMKFGLGGLFIDVPMFIKPYNTSQININSTIEAEPLYIVNLLTTKEPEIQKLILPEWYNTFYTSEEPKLLKTITTPNYSKSKGYSEFKHLLEIYFLKDSDARRYEKVLTDIARHESNFNPTVLNKAGAPAFGYFQFWQDGKINNITHFSGLNIDEFLNNPQAQIAAAVKMARSIVNSFNSQDLKMAQSMGYSMDALIRGAWLGGVGGVRKVLRGTGNPSDSKWYGGKGGRSVKQAMDEQI